MVVERSVSDKPFALAHVGKDAARHLVCESAPVAVEGKKIPERSKRKDEDENDKRHYANRPFPVKPPKGDEIAAKDRRVSARHDGEYAFLRHKRRGRKRRGDCNDREKRHGNVKEPLHQARLVVEGPLARKEGHEKREGGKDGNEHPRRRRRIGHEFVGHPLEERRQRHVKYVYGDEEKYQERNGKDR